MPIPPSPPSDPCLGIRMMLVFSHFYTVLCRFWRGTSVADTLPIRQPTTSSSAQNLPMTRSESQFLWVQAETFDDKGSPVYVNVYRIEMPNRQPNSHTTQRSLGLGKTVLGLAFQAVVGLVLASDEPASHLVPLNIVGVIMVFAFAASFSAIFLSRASSSHYRRAAYLIEKMGYVSAAIGFFLMTAIFLPKILTWICWISCAFTLLAFTLALIG